MVTIFLSGPNDCSSEKAITAKEISKLALTIKDAYELDLRLLTFENDTFSAIGKDGQDVVNTQIGDHYDIYMGLIKLRIGTKTPRDESGTAEEYQRALERHRRDGRPAMLFFEMDPIFKKSDATAAELSRVEHFVERVRTDGMLTKTVTHEELDVVIFTHVYKTLNDGGFLKNRVKGSDKPSLEEIRIATEELKVLSDTLHNAQLPMHENTLRQAEVIARLEGRPNSWFSKWINFGNSSTNNFILFKPQTEAQIQEAANELTSITSEMQELLHDFRPKYRAYIEAYVKL